MGILNDCENFADCSFAALVPTLLNSNYLRMYAGMHRGKLPQLLSSSSQPTNLKFAAQHDSLQSFVLIIISNLIKILFSDGRDFLPIFQRPCHLVSNLIDPFARDTKKENRGEAGDIQSLSFDRRKWEGGSSRLSLSKIFRTQQPPGTSNSVDKPIMN